MIHGERCDGCGVANVLNGLHEVELVDTKRRVKLCHRCYVNLYTCNCCGGQFEEIIDSSGMCYRCDEQRYLRCNV